MNTARSVIPISRDNPPMTTNLPEPLTPPDCDLSGFKWMKLDIYRLFRSELWAKATGDEFRAALKLWGESQWEKPAGSLPDDQHQLARLADFGRSLSDWDKVRDMALHGWIKCSDGRLYHPVIAEMVIEAWQERQQFQAIRESERLRKAEWRKNKANKNNKLENVPRDTYGTHTGHIPDVRSKTETETETETENNIFINSAESEKTVDPKTASKKPPSAKKQKTTLPPDFTISPQVQAWADKHGYIRLPERLENFKLACERNGYQYADWDAAFKTAIRDDWAKLSQQKSSLQGDAKGVGTGAVSGQRGGIHSGFDQIDYTRGIGPNGEF